MPRRNLFKINPRWVPFEQARTFACDLGLKNYSEWIDYIRGNRPDLPALPKDIPKYPHIPYKFHGWSGYHYWLGVPGKKFRYFSTARAYVHHLQLTKISEWRQYTNGKLPGKGIKPKNIPASPDVVYKDQGWISWADWFGIAVVDRKGIKYEPFQFARTFARSLQLDSVEDWYRFYEKEKDRLENRELRIPFAPNQVYKGLGWKGWFDWLGYHQRKGRKRQCKPYDEAKLFVHSLKIKSISEWQRYSSGKLITRKPMPPYIPAKPHKYYRNKGWISWEDWLGAKLAVATCLREYRSFEDAREFARNLKLRWEKEWWQYSKGELSDKPLKPEDVPASPEHIYRNQWKGWADWLGTKGKNAPRKAWLSFEEARDYVLKMRLKNYEEWSLFCKGRLPGKPRKPDNIPAGPERVYKNEGWKGLGDWLGTGNIANFNKKYRPYKEAKNFVHKLKLKNRKEWRLYVNGDFPDKGKKPDDIPSTPWNVYRDKGWQGMGDWLGTGFIAYPKREYLPFEEARKYIRQLEIKTSTEWRLYLKGKLSGKTKKPDNIPASPNVVYRDKGWNGFSDWLGTDQRMNHQGN